MERDNTNTYTKPQAIVFRLSPLISSQYTFYALHNTCFLYIIYTFRFKRKLKRETSKQNLRVRSQGLPNKALVHSRTNILRTQQTISYSLFCQ
ncbi:hypothetical protein EUGRSUZ_L03760 [Eucalyptus grandis]|uniref:Uncharacterized protein n=1 Tax=Eucalyptus grandis TaxID=71139 RepID=A0AAD9T835_EUCGR|nr:hypothetical protein EUGRSUZ_L03760 [Eucalyptus grandis]